MRLGIGFDFINGIMVGIEHISGDEEDDFHWLISVNVFIFTIVFMNVKVK